MTESYIIAIDIGKTNKKVLVFDSGLKIIETAYKNFDEYKDGNVVYEDLENMTIWLKEQIKTFAGKYQIKALSVSAHGATAFANDKAGNLAVPPVAYTTVADDAFREDFYQTFGTPQELKKETGTSEIGSLVNIGKLVYFMKKNWPEKWENVW